MRSVTSLPILSGDGAFARHRPPGTSRAALPCCWHKGRPVPEAAILGRRCCLNPLGLPSLSPTQAPGSCHLNLSHHPGGSAAAGPRPHLLAKLPSLQDFLNVQLEPSAPEFMALGGKTSQKSRAGAFKNVKVPSLSHPRRCLGWEALPYPPPDLGRQPRFPNWHPRLGGGGPEPGPRSPLPSAHLKSCTLPTLPRRPHTSSSSMQTSTSCPLARGALGIRAPVETARPRLHKGGPRRSPVCRPSHRGKAACCPGRQLR